MRKKETTAFARVLDMAQGGRRMLVRATCARCGATADIPPPPDAYGGSQALAKRFARMGWNCDPYRATRVYCPACAGKEKESDMAQTKPAPVENLADRQPTSDQRRRIREKLDGYFDDAKGLYLDGYSDQKIADELGVPRVFVERIRETGYGPVKANPELAALRAEAQALGKRLDEEFTEINDRFAKLQREMNNALWKLHQKLDALEKQA